jgi:hypothetical protein
VDVDKLIRRAAGREPPPELQESDQEADPIARQEALIEAAAVARGLTPKRAKDAARLADLDQLEAGKSPTKVVDELVARLPELRGGKASGIDEAIRARAGRSARPEQEPERRTSADGGVRQTAPMAQTFAQAMQEQLDARRQGAEYVPPFTDGG